MQKISTQDMKHPKEIAFTILMVSWVMLFASLFLSYALLRFKETNWPPMGFESVSLLWPWVSTISILLSSYFLHAFSKFYDLKNIKKANKNLVITFLLGLVFLVSQKMLWSHMNEVGLVVSSGIFSSILHGFTWVHAAHIVMGLIGLCFLRKFYNNFGDESFQLRIKHVSHFWHFLDIVWILMFLTMFLF